MINAKGIEEGAILRSKSAEALAVLKAHEPKLADNNSTLSKELIGANIRSVCPISSASERQICAGNIAKPIWERNAPDTIAYFDEFQRKQLEFARNFDTSGALETRKRATEYLTTGMKQAIAEFRENAQRDIAAANAQDAAARQRASQAFGEIVAGIAVASLAIAAGAAMAAYGAPPPVSYSSSNTVHCESRNLLGTVYTDCN